MNFKKIILIFLILFFSIEVSFAASYDDSITVFKDTFDNLISDLSADNDNSFFNKPVRYSFNSSDLIKDYNNASQYNVQVLANGEPVGPGEKVHLRINGVDYVRTTDYDGIAHLNIKLLPGNYIVYCEYETFKTYNNVMVI